MTAASPNGMPAASPNALPAACPNGMPAASPNAMVVDDAPDIRLLLRMVLSLEGFSVTEAESGRHALKLLAGGARRQREVVERTGSLVELVDWLVGQTRPEGLAPTAADSPRRASTTGSG